MPWGMVFPDASPLPRHPSQLYEMGLEGIVLFIIVFIYSLKPRPKGRGMALFLICYSVFRFYLEFFRAPDYQLGLFYNLFSMGQLLSLPMFFVGLYLWSFHAKLSTSA
jgi:phosphatidylglycerol:prolipoprotein diacylglycerol transferase